MNASDAEFGPAEGSTSAESTTENIEDVVQGVEMLNDLDPE